MKFTGSFWVKHKNTQVKEDSNEKNALYFQFSSVQLLSCLRLFVTPWTTACQTSLSITNSQNLPKLMFIESVMPSDIFRAAKLCVAWFWNLSTLYKMLYVLHVQLLTCVWLFATSWTLACQAPLPMGFYRQEYWSGLPALLGDLPGPGI